MQQDNFVYFLVNLHSNTKCNSCREKLHPGVFNKYNCLGSRNEDQQRDKQSISLPSNIFEYGRIHFTINYKGD